MDYIESRSFKSKGPKWDRVTRLQRARWNDILWRCLNPKHAAYADYGGRGIKVCARWADFEAFREDVGDPPWPKATLDRIDNNGHYEPGNVRWVSQREQARNRRPRKDGRWVEHEGRKISVEEAAKIVGASRTTIYKRLLRGEDPLAPKDGRRYQNTERWRRAMKEWGEKRRGVPQGDWKDL